MRQKGLPLAFLHRHFHIFYKKGKIPSGSVFFLVDCHSFRNSLWDFSKLHALAQNHKECKADSYDINYKIHHELM